MLKSIKHKMGKNVRKAIVRAAVLRLGIPEIALIFCMNKHQLSHSQYISFCTWAKKNKDFYYWLVNRIAKKA